MSVWPTCRGIGFADDATTASIIALTLSDASRTHLQKGFAAMTDPADNEMFSARYGLLATVASVSYRP